MLRRTVAAVSARRSIGGRFHAGEHLTRELAAADRVECERGAGGGERFDQLVHERRRTRSQHVLRAESLEEIHVLLPTDDVHERDPVFDADLDQHLTEVRRRDGVHQSGVALRAHRLDHAERRQRVHEARCALRRRRAGRQHEALARLDRPELRVHRAAEDRDRLSDEGARFVGGPGAHDHAGALVSDGQRLVDASGDAPEGRRRDRRRDDRVLGAAGDLRRRHVGTGEHQAEIRRIDRSRIDADHHFVGLGFRGRDTGERQLENAFLLHRRA